MYILYRLLLLGAVGLGMYLAVAGAAEAKYNPEKRKNGIIKMLAGILIVVVLIGLLLYGIAALRAMT